MAKADIINILYSKNKTPLEFVFDNLNCRPLSSLLYQSDIDQLHNIATSLRYNANIDLKYKTIDKIMKPRGFKKLGSGTNRVVYSYLEDDSFVVKLALDRVGLGDNPAEFKNQILLQPFITKVFEVSPCGTIATFERVMPILSKKEFINISDDVFNMITNCIIGKYILSDFGEKYYMNYGLRKGFGPVLLDFPYVFELDGNKLYCNKLLDNNTFCGGEIDYDDGFDELVCKRCGKKYLAEQLKKNAENNIVILRGDSTMNISIRKGNKVIKTLYKEREDDFIDNSINDNSEEDNIDNDTVLISKESFIKSLDKDTDNIFASRIRIISTPKKSKKKNGKQQQNKPYNKNTISKPVNKERKPIMSKEEPIKEVNTESIKEVKMEEPVASNKIKEKEVKLYTNIVTKEVIEKELPPLHAEEEKKDYLEIDFTPLLTNNGKSFTEAWVDYSAEAESKGKAFYSLDEYSAIYRKYIESLPDHTSDISRGKEKYDEYEDNYGDEYVKPKKKSKSKRRSKDVLDEF